MIGAVVLAGGASRRLGRPKQLVQVRGTTLVRQAVIAAKLSKCDAVCVVSGAHAAAVEREVVELGVTIVHNGEWEEGMASSIRAGVAWAVAARCDAVVLCVCDQPKLSARHLNALIAEFKGEPVGSRYAGGNGVPAVFGREQYAALLALRGDRGARGLLEGAAAIEWPEGEIDIDTDEDLRSSTSTSTSTIPSRGP